MYLSAYANNNRLLVSEGQTIKNAKLLAILEKPDPGKLRCILK